MADKATARPKDQAVKPSGKKPVKKQAAKKSASKPTPTRKKESPVKHPFGTCVPLGECVCANKKGTN